MHPVIQKPVAHPNDRQSSTLVTVIDRRYILEIQPIGFQVDENLAGLGAIAGGQHSDFFKIIDHVGGAVVAKAQTPLQI